MFTLDDILSKGAVTEQEILPLLKSLRASMAMKNLKELQNKHAAKGVRLQAGESDTEYIERLIRGEVPLVGNSADECIDIYNRNKTTKEIAENKFSRAIELFCTKLAELVNPQFVEVHACIKQIAKAQNPSEDFYSLSQLFNYGLPSLVEYETKKGKLLIGILLNTGRKRVAEEIDPYTWQITHNGDKGYFIRWGHFFEIPDTLLTPSQSYLKSEIKNVSNTHDVLEQTGGLHGRTGTTGYSETERGQLGELAADDREQAGDEGLDRPTEPSVSDSDVASALSTGDGKLSRDGEQSSSIDGTDLDGGRSNRDDTNGLSDDGSRRAGTAKKRVVQTRERTELRRIEQEKVQDKPTVWNDEQDIREALPLLFKEQQDDVIKFEKRIIEQKQNGMLFTNGTGTGKTFTALGTVKRFYNAGKKNILIVTMNDKIVQDFINSGSTLGLNIYKLDNTNDNGDTRNPVVITTYANFRQNASLVRKDWDLLVMDEAHNLMQGQNSGRTSALKVLRGLTGHHDKTGFDAYMTNKYAEQYPYTDEQGNDISSDEADPIKKQKWNKLYETKWKAWQERWMKQENLPKVIFLSATPFSYVETLDWAEGYLFNYAEPKVVFDEGDGSRDDFYIQHLGYRRRSGKLTRPDAQANQGMLEREFAEQLKNSGAMSGRELTIPFDYDRKFILLPSAIGEVIDEGIDYLFRTKDQNDRQRFAYLYQAVCKRFTYIKRRQLLEALKAVEIIPYIRKNLALKRKVVVFHDYNEGGSFNPFKFNARHELIPFVGEDKVAYAWGEYEAFAEARPDLIGLKCEADSVQKTLTKKFPYPSQSLLFNGTISKGKRQQAVNLFNDDNSGMNLLIVQSDAGSTGISLHDTTGKMQRVSINLGVPVKPAMLRQTEGRIYRLGQASNAIQRYVSTGTDWELTAFSETIAGRAETVDNLAKGHDNISSIREQLVDAYLEARYEDPSDQDGIGGKAIEAELAKNRQLSEHDKAVNYYYKRQGQSSGRNNREGVDYYATPEPIGLLMMKLANAHSGDKVLEPSAGHGAIARFAPQDSYLTVIEPSEALCAKAQLNCSHESLKAVNDSFENFDTVNKFDCVVMNPPFGVGGNLAINHIEKAFKHLREGGRIVALIPRGKMDSRLDEFLADYADNAELIATYELPSCTFGKEGTKVVTRIVVIERINPLFGKRGYVDNLGGSEAKDINTLFNDIKHLRIADRRPRKDEMLAEYGLMIEADKGKYYLSGKGLSNAHLYDLLKFYAQDTENYEVGGKVEYTFVLKYDYTDRILKDIIKYEQEKDLNLKIAA